MSRRFAIALAVSIASASLYASPRTFVSSTGIDTNPCNRTAPCRSFTAALAVTDLDGEVVVIDSAGYGPTSIAQPVSIITPAGVYAGITATSGSGISIAVAANDRVVLKGLTINGLGATANGVLVSAAGRVLLNDLTITGFDSAQINAGAGSVSVHRCAIQGGPSSFGIFVASQLASATAFVENTTVEGADAGIVVSVNGTVTVIDSYIHGCSSAAFRAQTGGTANIERTALTGSGFGISTICTLANPTVRLSNNTIVANATGVNACATSVVFTRQNNTIAGNTTDFAGSALATLSNQ